MKLTVPKGELSLPSDFSFEVEQNSAFFSTDGAQTIPATIPATPSDLAKLDFPNRLGRRNRYVNSFPATLQKGVFQKQGVLVVTTTDDTSVSCSIAVEDSEFYTQYKDTNLKDLFSAKVLTDYSTPEAWYEYLFKVYKQEVDCDFRLFPVAVNCTDGDYQINNEPSYKAASEYKSIWPLVHGPRVVQEDGDDVSVPEGYGIAPFLKLYRFFELIFFLCGYTVAKNCFETDSHLSSLVLLHSCSDVICNGKIDYSDLVPNKTISEILEWMNNKFHAQIAVRPGTKEVSILLLEDIIAAGFDLDLTGKAVGSPQYSYSSGSRVVMTPDTSLEGAEGAAETLQALVKKYKYILPVDESAFASLSTPCLCLRLATGDYYEVRVSFISYGSRGGSSTRITYKKVKVGTNIIKYDRQNADDSEEFSPEDLVPPMVAAGDPYIRMPYVGTRTHRNTSYNDSEKDEDQDIIIADYMGLGESYENPTSGGTNSRLVPTSDGKVYLATTQAYNNRGHLRSGAISLTPEDYVATFFSGYNKHIRNNAIEVSGEFNLTIEQLMGYDMYSLKLLDGQTLLPTYLKYEVGRRVKCTEAKYRLFKDFADGQEDEPITAPEPLYQWQLNQTQITSKVAELQAQQSTGTVMWKYDETDPFIQDEDKDVFIPSPTALGVKSVTLDRVIYFFVRTTSGRTTHDTHLETDTLQEWFDSVEIP